MAAVIDLRSDTLTQPTPEMRAAIANAVVGDEQKREDPTVLELEERAAALLGQEAAVFVPTATMANQIALRLLGEPGDELLAHEHSHVLLYELGGPAVHAGLVTRGLPGEHGRLTANQIRRSVRYDEEIHHPLTRVVSLDAGLAQQAAEVGLTHRLALADSIVYATALAYDADVITSDAHFEGLPLVTYLPRP
jgi:threonine aldolase